MESKKVAEELNTKSFFTFLDELERQLEHENRKTGLMQIMATGIKALDESTGIGGLPRGRLIEFAGKDKAYLVPFAYYLLAQLQKRYRVAVVIDQNDYDRNFLERVGLIRTSKVYILPGDFFLSRDILFEHVLKNDMFDIIVVFESAVSRLIVDTESCMSLDSLEPISTHIKNTKTSILIFRDIDEAEEADRCPGIQKWISSIHFELWGNSIVFNNERAVRISYATRLHKNDFSFSLSEFIVNVPIKRNRAKAGTEDELALWKVPIRFYLSKYIREEPIVIEDALKKLLRAYGFSYYGEELVVVGSFFKRAWATTKRFFKKPEVEHKLREIEKAAELQIIGKPQGEIDRNQAEAMAKLIGAVSKTNSDAVIQVGSILFVATTDEKGKKKFIGRTLTTNELLEISKNENILKIPDQAFDELQKPISDGSK